VWYWTSSIWRPMSSDLLYWWHRRRNSWWLWSEDLKLWRRQCSRNRLSLTSRPTWDLRLIAYRPINRFYRSTIYRQVFSSIPCFSTKSSKICYAKTTLEYWTKVLPWLIAFESTKMVKFEIIYTSTRLLAKNTVSWTVNRLPNCGKWQNLGYFGRNISLGDKSDRWAIILLLT
jgi:hypothetical protein